MQREWRKQIFTIRVYGPRASKKEITKQTEKRRGRIQKTCAGQKAMEVGVKINFVVIVLLLIMVIQTIKTYVLLYLTNTKYG